MRRRIENKLHIVCNDVDLTTLTNIEFYLKQGGLFFQYVPEVISANEMLIDIPMEDAMMLRLAAVQVQFAFTDANGTPMASDIVDCAVGDLLKEVGYDPI